jgi:pimeloyl-ACP methyl ester carboxylesterase
VVRLRRWPRRLALALLVFLAVITVASIAYDVATNGRERPAQALYAGPYVPVDGTLVAYRHWGNTGTPIILIGGFVEPSWVWHRLGPLLGLKHRVYAIDLPPFGYTERNGHYTLSSWVSLLHDFERELGIVRPIVVGHSLGAAVAVADTFEHPGEAAGIVLLDGDALAAGGGAGWLTHLLVNPYYTSVFRIGTGADWIVRRALDNAYGPHAPSPSHDDLLEWERPFRVKGTPAAFKKLLSYGIQGYQLDQLKAVRVPRIVVWGADDTVDSVTDGRRTAAILHAPFVLVPAAGHLSMLSNPTRVASTIDRFDARADAR